MQTAEQLFNDSMRHTKAMIYYQPAKAWIWGGAKLTPDQVINELQQRGLTITRRTLLNWEKAELIPAASRGSHGQGGGKWADYPTDTIPEALTAHLLKDVFRMTNAEIAQARADYAVQNYNWRSVRWYDFRRAFAEGYNYPDVKAAAQTAYDDGLFPLLIGQQFYDWMIGEITKKGIQKRHAE